MRQKAGIHDVVQWGRGPNGPFGRGRLDRVGQHEEVVGAAVLVAKRITGVRSSDRLGRKR